MPLVPSRVPGGGASPDARYRRSGSRVFNKLRKPEIENLRETVRRDHDVLGLQVAMNDAGFMGLSEAVGHLGRDRQDAPQSAAARRRSAAEGFRP